MTPSKVLFNGPDPPMDRPEPDLELLEAQAKEAAAAKKKGAKDAEEVVEEVKKDP